MSNIVLSFTKFLDVKSPLGYSQKETAKCPFQSIGVDLYMPKPTLKFVEGLIVSNIDSFENKYVLGEHKFTQESIDSNGKLDLLESFKIVDSNGDMFIEFTNGKYIIADKIQIPSGVGILIPEDYWADLRSKSGNFKNNYTVIHGTIDEDYTYGMGMQIIPLTTYIQFMPDEKISQFVLVKGNKIETMLELTNEEWSHNLDVVKRRLSRQGGFGHTGKFDK